VNVADSAMYQAKSQGRDRIVLAPDSVANSLSALRREAES